MRLLGAVLLGLILATSSLARAEEPAPVACKTVDDCWLDDDARPIRRPKQHAKKPLPRGDCGKRLKWLRTRLTCEENICVAKNIGDKC